MHLLLQICNFIYFLSAVIFVTPCLVFTTFWLVYIIYRIFQLYKKYKKLRLYSELYPADFYMDFFNCKVKFVIYSFLLFILISELVSVVGYSAASLLLISQSSYQIPSPYPLYIPLNCTDGIIELWQVEMSNPLAALFSATGNIAILVLYFLLTSLMNFIFLAYQHKTNHIKVGSIFKKLSCITPLLFILSSIPQAQILGKILIPFFAIIFFLLFLKHQKRYVLILKWRCDDASILQDKISFTYHSKIRRNSEISIHLVAVGLAILLLAMVLTQFTSLLPMLLTEKSKYLTRTFSLDLNLSFLDCAGQQIIYFICSVIDMVVPLLVLVGFIIYNLPLIAVSFSLIVFYLCKRCWSVESFYFRV